MATLYELAKTYQELYEKLASEVIDDQTFQDTLESIEFDESFEEKAEGYAKIIASLKADSKSIKAEEERLSARRKALESNASRLLDNLYAAMKSTGKEKFKTTLFSFGIQKSPPALRIDSDADIPEKFLLPQPSKVDTGALKEAIKNGANYPGIELTQGESLRIR